MKKIIFSILIALVVAGFVLYGSGLYPVVSVNGTLISMRAWQRILNAEKRVINVRAYSAREPMVDFSSPKNASLLVLIRRTTLTVLIDSVLMKQEGLGPVPDLEQLSVQRVNDELRSGNLTEQAASAVYGLDLAALKEAVLIPQARQEILSDTLAARQKDFSEWIAEVRTRAHVRFFFTSFQWDRDGVK